MNSDISEKEKLSYIAGLIDADGCLMLSKRAKVHFTPQLTFVNTNKEVVDWVSKELGVKTYKMVIYKRQKNRKPTYQVVMQGREKVKETILKLLPYLIVKKRKAELLLEYHSLHKWKQGMRVPLSSREKEIYLEMKELNRVGRKER